MAAEKEVIIGLDIWGRLVSILWQFAGPGWLALLTFMFGIGFNSPVALGALVILTVCQILHILFSVIFLSRFSWLNKKYAVNSNHIVEIGRGGSGNEGRWQELQAIHGRPIIRPEAFPGLVDLIRILFGYQEPITLVFSNSRILLPRIGPPILFSWAILLPILKASNNTPMLEEKIRDWIAEAKRKN